VLVDTLTTDGQFDIGNGALSHPTGVGCSLTGNGGESASGHLEVHVTDKVTIAGNSNRKTTAVSGGTVHSLLDVLHGEVGVALVHRLEESNLGVTS